MDILSIIRNQIKKAHSKSLIPKLLEQAEILPESNDTILLWVPGGMSLMLHVEGAIALALKLRGHKVHAVICDGLFGACVRREVTSGIPISNWPDLCGECRAENSKVLDTLQIEYSYIGDFVQENISSLLKDMAESITWASLNDLTYKNIMVGDNVRSSVIRYLKGRPYAGHEAVVQEYAYSGLIAAASAISAVDSIRPSRMFMSHGTYVDWGPALRVALANKIPITAWMASYLKARFYFRHVEDLTRIDFHNLSGFAWEERRSRELSLIQNARLDRFLADRYQKQTSFDMKHFQAYTGDVDRLRKRYKLVENMPVWGIMAHINWDSVADYAPMAFDSFDDWMLETVREAINITDVQWLIKIHPAEAWDNPDSGVQQLIKNNFRSLPPHIQVIPAEEKISPLDFFGLLDGGVTVFGTPGLELSLHAKPVILAGEAHYGGKGFTHDGLDSPSYIQLLRKAALLEPLSERQLHLARKYAYCYFIQRQIPFRVVEDSESEWWKFQLEKSHLLLSGRDPFVDLICNRFLDGRDFIMNEQLVGIAETGHTNSGSLDDKDVVLDEV